MLLSYLFNWLFFFVFIANSNLQLSAFILLKNMKIPEYLYTCGGRPYLWEIYM